MSNTNLPQLSIVIPLFNEEKVFTKLTERLDAALLMLNFEAEIVLVDDGSHDQTRTLIREKCLRDSNYKGILLSRNHGHQLALSAGLKNASGTKAIMVMDGDLQDPPELIIDFYNKHLEGYDVVYAIRGKRKENFIKKIAYWTYYRLQRSVSNFEIPIDSGDFGLMSRRVVDTMNAMPEQSRYLRGMRSWVGFKQIGLSYGRDARMAGKSNYSFRQLLNLAFNGIFNFSEFPVKLITHLGIYSILLSLIYIGFVIYERIVNNNVPAGFTSLIIAIVLFSGVQLISIGLIGEYVLRIYNQVRNRPLFVIDEVIEKPKN
ncbi:MAG: glycosyltransferase family 2 protein [Bacteroidetes bacterium]|nr:glycosyltransferase family 2 protein [Bacteroidota bacterium]